MKNICCSCYESNKAAKRHTPLISLIILLSWPELFRSYFVTQYIKFLKITNKTMLREARPKTAPFFSKVDLQGFPQALRTWEGLLKMWWEGTWVNRWGEHGGLKQHSKNLDKIFEKYLWRSLFVKVASYKPGSCNFTKKWTSSHIFLDDFS